MNSQSLLKSYWDALTNLVFPQLCSGCGTEVSANHVLCPFCLVRLPLTHFTFYANNPVEKIFWGRLPLVFGTSYTYFTRNSLVQHLLHELKYRANREIGLYFGRRIGETLLSSSRFDPIEALVPLPLNEKKERKRGYNQASVICEGINQSTGVPVFEKIVSRPIFTKTQTEKDRVERWKSTAGRFRLEDADILAGKHVLLIDDVITTGATLESCGLELLKTPGLRLSVATMAYTAN